MMKKLGLSFVLALSPVAVAVAACGGEAPPPAQPAPTTAATTPSTVATAPAAPSATAEQAPAPKASMADMQKKSILAQQAAFNAHDAKALASLYSADAVMWGPASDGFLETNGREAIQRMHEGLFQAVDVKLGMVRVFQKGDVAVVEWVSNGTDNATKKNAGFRALSVQWFDADGLVKKDHTYFDMGTIAIQTGKVPGKAREMPTLATGEPQFVLAKNDDAETKLVDTMKGGWPASWPKHDKKAYETSFTDDYVHEEIASPFDYRGKTDAMKELDMYVKAVPDMAFTIENAWAIGDVVVAEWTFKGTHKGALGPLKASNKSFTIHGADVDWFKGDKLAKASSYSNSLEFLTQIGAVPAAPAAAATAAKKDDAKKDQPAPASKK